MQENGIKLIRVAVIIYLLSVFASGIMHDTCASGLNEQTGNIGHALEIAPPFDGALKYPFTQYDSQRCGYWRPGSQDYPYFGAPRDGNTRYHAGIDLYPVKGAGTPVKAMKDGRVIKIAPFYKRRNGEITYAMLIDHKEFVANYAELRKPALMAGTIVKQSQIIGFISGTRQLHLELYKPGTEHWSSWYGNMPLHLIDPTDMMKGIYRKNP
jgi:murein DD-endopeptidase MepM/ murein hydrolase activator NlpD